MEHAAVDLIQCANCGARNRIPVERAGSQAKCGRCHAPLSKGRQEGHGTAYIMRCSECGTKNRVHLNTPAEQPKCGKCGAKLRTSELHEPQPVLISDRNFHEKVLKSPLPVLVFAMSPTCPGCGMAAPHIDAFAKEAIGKVKVGRLNIQHNPELAARFDILSVPYLLIFDKGRLVQSLPGGLDKRQLRELMMRYLY